MVDGRLSTHRRIDLGEQCRWYLYIPDAPLVARRRITCNIPDDTAAHSNNRTIAVVTAIDETIRLTERTWRTSRTIDRMTGCAPVTVNVLRVTRAWYRLFRAEATD